MLIAAASSSGINITSTQILAFCAVATLAVGLALALNSWLKDRGERDEKRRDEDDDERSAEDSRYQEMHDELVQFRIAMVGTAGDPSRNIRGVDGFVQRQERHNGRVDERLANIDDELATTNGGGTIKGSLGLLRDEVAAVKDDVAEIRRSGGLRRDDL